METIIFAGVALMVDEIGLPVKLDNGIRCGSCKSRHGGVASVKLCYEMQAEFRAEQEAELAAEMRVERYFEDRGYEAARAQEDWEARNGVVSFSQAWHNESPDTCPCCN